MGLQCPLLVWFCCFFLQLQLLPLSLGRMPLPLPLSALSGLATRFSDEVRFRKLPIDQYRRQIKLWIDESVKELKRNQEELTQDKNKQLERYKAMFDELYLDSIESLNKQADALNELNTKLKKYSKERPKQIDSSLDDFRRFFNSTQMGADAYAMPVWTSQKMLEISRQNSLNKTFNMMNNTALQSILETVNMNLAKNKVGSKEIQTAQGFIDNIKRDFQLLQQDWLETAIKIEKVCSSLFSFLCSLFAHC